MQRWPEGELDTQERGGSGRFDEARWTPFQDPPAAGGGRKGGRGRGGKTRSGRGEGGKWEVIKAGYRAQHRGNVNLGRGGGGGFQARMPARGGVQSLVAPQREVFIQSRMHQHPLTGSMRQSHSGKPVHAPASHGDSSRVHPSRLPLPGMQHAPNCPLHHHHHAGQ